jgi:hypothetical protein
MKSQTNVELSGLCRDYYATGMGKGTLGVIADWLADHGDARAEAVRSGDYSGIMAELHEAEFAVLTTPEIGKAIIFDTERSRGHLCQDETGRAPFAVCSSWGQMVPVDVKVTGRTMQWKDHKYRIRAKITVYAGTEHAKKIGGWLVVG